MISLASFAQDSQPLGLVENHLPCHRHRTGPPPVSSSSSRAGCRAWSSGCPGGGGAPGRSGDRPSLARGARPRADELVDPLGHPALPGARLRAPASLAASDPADGAVGSEEQAAAKLSPGRQPGNIEKPAVGAHLISVPRIGLARVSSRWCCIGQCPQAEQELTVHGETPSTRSKRSLSHSINGSALRKLADSVTSRAPVLPDPS